MIKKILVWSGVAFVALCALGALLSGSVGATIILAVIAFVISPYRNLLLDRLPEKFRKTGIVVATSVVLFFGAIASVSTEPVEDNKTNVEESFQIDKSVDTLEENETKLDDNKKKSIEDTSTKDIKKEDNILANREEEEEEEKSVEEKEVVDKKVVNDNNIEDKKREVKKVEKEQEEAPEATEVAPEIENVSAENGNDISKNNLTAEEPPSSEATEQPIPVAAEPIVPQENAGTVTDTSQMVYLSATGSKYHRINNCGNMNPNKARAVSESYAISHGKERCSNCW